MDLLLPALAALIFSIHTLLETHRVRDGWMRKNFRGTHVEFVARYRRRLTVFGWVYMVLFILNLGLAAIEPDPVGALIAGGIWLAAGGIFLLWSRRALDQPISD